MIKINLQINSHIQVIKSGQNLVIEIYTIQIVEQQRHMDYVQAEQIQKEAIIADQILQEAYQQRVEQREIEQQEYLYNLQQQLQLTQELNNQQVIAQEVVQPVPAYRIAQDNFAEEEMIRQEIKQQRLSKEELRYAEEEARLQSEHPRVSNSQFQSVIYYSSFFEWKEGVGSIVNTDIKEIRIGEKVMRLDEISKIKIMKETAINNSRKIKITNLNNDVLFSVESNKNIYGLPLQFFWFAKIITDKLRFNDYDLNNPYIPQSTFANKNIKNSIVQGIIFKQSQYLKTWELRFVAITPDGLFSFKDQNGAQTFSIKKDTVTEIWTRFQLHERLLVIKVHHGSRKTQFGIPIVDYCNDMRTNWLYAFYGLLYPS